MTNPPDESGTGPHGGPAFRIPESPNLPHRLGRQVNHDPRSRQFAYRAAPKTELHAVRHDRHVPIFDQGNLGSCTGNAAVGCMATGQFFATITEADADWLEPLDEDAAVHCYSEATKIDPFPGHYDPDDSDSEDTGSDGLSVAKILKGAGAISGYQWAFSLDDALAALMDRPLITGTVWLNGMFDPDAEGIIHPTGGIAGGHEYAMVEYDPTRGMVGFDQSWGRWGLNGTGRFYIPAEEYGGQLLARDGDVTIFEPIVEPAPTPAVDPASPADRRLWDSLKPYATRTGWFGVARRKALRDWHSAKSW